MTKKFTTIRNLQDKVLVTKTRSGKEQAYAKIYDKYYDDIYRFIFFRVSSVQVAEDLAADVFMKAWKYITEQKKTIENCRALLYRIARYTVIDYYRKHKAIPLENEEIDAIVVENRIEQKIDLQLDLELVQGALIKLSKEEQQIIVLRFIRELSYREIAEVVGKKRGAIRVLVHRTIKKLQQIIIDQKN